MVHWDWPGVILRGGVGLRGGAAHLAGEPRVREAAQARGGWGGWAGPCAAASVTIAPARRLAVELAVESGYAVIGVQGIVAGKSEVAVDGAWLGIHLGIGFF